MVKVLYVLLAGGNFIYYLIAVLAHLFTSPFQSALPCTSQSLINSCGDTSSILTHIYPTQSTSATDVPVLPSLKPHMNQVCGAS